MKYKPRLALEIGAFAFIYGIQVLIIAMSRIPQEAYNFNEVIMKSSQLDMKTYILVLAASMLFFALFLRTSGKKWRRKT